MRPNQLHYVVTLEESIAFGKHFYSSSNIVESCCGIVHSFFSDDVITNARHDELLIQVPSFLWYWLRFYEGENGEQLPEDLQQPSGFSPALSPSPQNAYLSLNLVQDLILSPTSTHLRVGKPSWPPAVLQYSSTPWTRARTRKRWPVRKSKRPGLREVAKALCDFCFTWGMQGFFLTMVNISKVVRSAGIIRWRYSHTSGLWWWFYGGGWNANLHPRRSIRTP